MPNKIIAIVKFNDGEAYVMRDPIKLTYKQYGNTIIGTDGVFISCLYHESPSGRWQAFAGREFDITLENGDVIKCKGQWWSGVSKKAIEIIGRPFVYNVIACYVGALKACYVYNGYCAIEDELNKLRAEYKGVKYEYYDYDYILNGRKIDKNSVGRIKRQIRHSAKTPIRKLISKRY